MSKRLTALRRSLGDLNSSYIQAVALVFSLERLYGGKYVPHIGSHRSPFLYLKILIAAGTAGGAMVTDASFLRGATGEGANFSLSPLGNLIPPTSLPGAAPPPHHHHHLHLHHHHPATPSLPFPHMNISSNGEESGEFPGSVPRLLHAAFLQGERYPEEQTMPGPPPPPLLLHTTSTTTTPAAVSTPPPLLFSGGNGDANRGIGGGGGVGGFWALSQRDYLLGLLDIFMPRRTEMELSMRESLMDFCSAMWSSSFRFPSAAGDPTCMTTSSSTRTRSGTCSASKTSSSSCSSPRITSTPVISEDSFSSVHSSPSSSSASSPSNSSTEWSAEELVGLYRRKLALQAENNRNNSNSNNSSSNSVVDGNPSSSSSSMMGSSSSSSPSPPVTTTTTTTSSHPERGEETPVGNGEYKGHIPSTTTTTSSSSTSFSSPSTPSTTPTTTSSRTRLPVGRSFHDDGAETSHHEDYPLENGSFSSSSSSSFLMPSCDPNELILLDSITAISSSFFQGVTGRVLVFDAIATCMAAEETIRLEALKRRRERKLRTLWEFYEKEAAANAAAGAPGLPPPPSALSSSSSHLSTSPTSSSSSTTTMTAGAGGGGGRLHPQPNHPNNSSSSSSSPDMENPVLNGAGADGDVSTPSSSSSSSSSYPSSLYFPSRPPPRYYSGAQRDKIHRIAQGIAVSSAMTERMEQLLRQEKQQGWIKRRLLLLSPYQPTTTPRALEQYSFPPFGPPRDSHHPSLSSLTGVMPAGGGNGGNVSGDKTKVSRADALSSDTEKYRTEEKEKRGEKGGSPQPTGPSDMKNKDVGMTTPMMTMMKKKKKDVEEEAAVRWTPDQQRRVLLLTRMRPEEEVEDFILRCEPIRQHMIRVIRRGRKQMMRKKVKEQLEQQQEHREQKKVE